MWDSLPHRWLRIPYTLHVSTSHAPKRPVIIVGHSLGALVAIETAKRYPPIVRSLILCSPPLYRPVRAATRRDALLRLLYRLIQKHPEQIVKISALALKLGLVNKTFSLQDKDISSYMSALEASIINQTSLDDAKKVKKPIHVITGRLDPVVIKRNIKELGAANSRVHLTSVTAGHEVRGRFVPAVIAAIGTASK